jgi:hypothetical protein
MAKNFIAMLGVRDLGVELQAVNPAGVIGHSGKRAGWGLGECAKPTREAKDAVAVTHPDLERCGNTFK